MESPRKIEQYSQPELLSAFFDFFGAPRAVSILGWCFISLMSGTDNPAELRRRFEARGLNKSAFYRALDDLRAFQEKVEEEPLPRRDSSYALALAKRLTAASAAL